MDRNPPESVSSQATQSISPWSGGQQWSTTPPTEPGWYWAWDRREAKAIIVHAFYMGRGDRFFTLVSDWDNRSAEEFTHWLGPLPVPEPPHGEFVKTGDFLFDGHTMTPAPEPPKE